VRVSAAEAENALLSVEDEAELYIRGELR